MNRNHSNLKNMKLQACAQTTSQAMLDAALVLFIFRLDDLFKMVFSTNNVVSKWHIFLHVSIAYNFPVKLFEVLMLLFALGQ